MKSANKRGLTSKPHREAMKEEGPLFFGDFERPVKGGKFTLPPLFRKFKDGKATVFWKTSDSHALTLLPHTDDRSLARYKPEITRHVSLGSGGAVNLGADICLKVFGRFDFDAVIYGDGNGVQIWDKKALLNWQKTKKDKYMNDWNEQTIRESFITRYRNSVRYCKIIQDAILIKTDTYKNIYDEHWAGCFVFEDLQLSSCLKSREQLLIELNLMIGRKITPFGACNREIFENHRITIINRLIAEFKQDGLHAVPPDIEMRPQVNSGVAPSQFPQGKPCRNRQGRLQMQNISDRDIESSWVVANRNMNRERQFSGPNSYERDIRFDMSAFIQSRPKARWLDLCCGTGRALIHASMRFGNRLECHGVDLVDCFAPVPDRANVTFHAASLRIWECADSFDLITCIHGLHYIGDKLGLIERANQWLTRDGLFLGHLDLADIYHKNHKAFGPVLGKAFRRLGISYNTRTRIISFRGGQGRPLRFNYVYAGAVPDAGPNFTGQDSVRSIYSS